MQFFSDIVSEDLLQRSFLLDDVTGVIWSPNEPSDAEPLQSRPLILLGHGGGQHKRAPGVVARAQRFASNCGFTVVAIDAPGHGDRSRTRKDERSVAAIKRTMEAGEPTGELIAAYNADLAKRAVPEWQAVLDNLLALGVSQPAVPVGYWGISLGGAIGVALVAGEPRIRAAVIGLVGDKASQAAATQVRVPIEMLLQWNDEHVSRSSCLALFDALGSSEKTLHANSGRHLDVPRHEVESAERFFTRNLVKSGAV